MDRTELTEYATAHWPALYEMGWKDPRGWVNYFTKNPNDFPLSEIGVTHIEKLASQAETGDGKKDRNTVADEVTQWFGVVARILELHKLGVTPEDVQERLLAPDGGKISMDTIRKKIKDEDTRVDHYLKSTKRMDQD